MAAVTVSVALAGTLSLLLGVGTGSVSADDPNTVTTRLKPGINFVGWVGGDTSVATFFAAVPQVVAVFAWSPQDKQWLFASPLVGAEFNTLRWLTPGMGLVVRLRNEREVEWKRAFSRASGSLSLRPGFNLIAWSGGRSSLLSEIERHLRQTFRAYSLAGVQSPEHLFTPDLSELVDEYGRVEHGGALWVYTEDGGTWSQRSDGLNRIPGRVLGPDGEGVGGVLVTGSTAGQIGWHSQVTTKPDGSFSTFAVADSLYTLRLKHRQNCSSYYLEHGTTEQLEAATRIDTSEDVGGIEFRIGEGACGWYIRGTVVDAAGAPIAGRRGAAIASIPARGGYTSTGDDGSFAVHVPDNVEYVLRVSVQPTCVAWFDGAGLALDQADAEAISVSGVDSSAHRPQATHLSPDPNSPWRNVTGVLRHGEMIHSSRGV